MGAEVYGEGPDVHPLELEERAGGNFDLPESKRGCCCPGHVTWQFVV